MADKMVFFNEDQTGIEPFQVDKNPVKQELLGTASSLNSSDPVTTEALRLARIYGDSYMNHIVEARMNITALASDEV